MKTKDARSLPAVAQEAIRIKAVKAVLSGKSQVEVAALFGVTRQAIGKWIKRFRHQAQAALKAKGQGRPKGGALKAWQSAQIAKSVIDKTPDQLKFPFYLWTREAVARLIEQRFGLQVSVWTVGRHLRRWGFSPQKPIRRAIERNPQAFKLWLEQEYPAIHRQAATEGAQILWGDEMGLRSDHCLGRSFSKKGDTPVILTSGQRFGCNMISAITNQGRLNFMVFKGNFNTAVFLDFLKRMVRHCPHKVFLIVDRHRAIDRPKCSSGCQRTTNTSGFFICPATAPS